MKHRETRSGHVPPQPSAAAAFHARRQRGPQWKVYPGGNARGEGEGERMVLSSPYIALTMNGRRPP